MRLLAVSLCLIGAALLAAPSSARADDASEDYRLEGLSTWPGGSTHGSGHSGGGSSGSSGGGSSHHPGDGNCPHSLASAVVEEGAPNRSGRYDTITGALCAAVSGGTVYVHPGIYTEHFNIYRAVTLWGIDHRAGGLGQPIVQGPTNAGCSTIYTEGDVTIRNIGFHGGGAGGGGCLIAQDGTLTLDHVTIAGQGGGTGLTVRNSATSILDSEIRNLRDGVLVSYGSETGTVFSMDNSRVLYNRTGLVVESQAQVALDGNLFFGNEDFGVYMQSGEGRLSDNRMFRNGTGLFLLERRPSQVSGNFFAGNQVGAFAPFSPDTGLYGRNRFECNGIDIRDGEYFSGDDYDDDGYESPVCAALYEY